jgi:2-methylisocitrate lyase-like PEP mutase family enzyme
MRTTSGNTATEAFRALHASGCFLLPNPWDVGSAVYLYRLGYKALATTSAGFAFSRGLQDSSTALELETVLEHQVEIVRATPLPVTADFQDGYAKEPRDVADNVEACLRTGVAGLSIEDSTGDPRAPLFERRLAIERVRAACAARDAHQPSAIVTARCEAWLVGDSDPARTALDRLIAFAEAGADCLYAPGVRDLETIASIVRAVAPRAVNVLVSAPSPELSLRSLEDLGVRRISVGSAMARVAWGAFARAARAILETGGFDSFEGAAPHAELDELFDQGSRSRSGPR